MTRTYIIQSVIDSIGAKTYLEIGTAKGESLIPIKVKNKIAIDTKFKISWQGILKTWRSTSYYKMPSDDYFARYNHNFDVAFIDGLHTFEQSLKDVNNCLTRLNPNGIILMHDCNPTSEDLATPTYHKGSWCGEVWKTILTLRTRPDLKVYVLDCDYGIGIIKRGEPDSLLNISLDAIRQMTYKDLEADRITLLNLKPSGLAL